MSSVEEDDGGAAAFIKCRYSRDEDEPFPCGEGRGSLREVLLRVEVLNHVLFSDGDVSGIIVIGNHENRVAAEFDGHQHRDVAGIHGAPALGVRANPVRCGGLREAPQQRCIWGKQAGGGGGVFKPFSLRRWVRVVDVRGFSKSLGTFGAVLNDVHRRDANNRRQAKVQAAVADVLPRCSARGRISIGGGGKLAEVKKSKVTRKGLGRGAPFATFVVFKNSGDGERRSWSDKG